MSLRIWLAYLCLLIFHCANYFVLSNDQNAQPQFPLQLTADVVVIAGLVEEGSEYPPREKKMRIHYDYIKKRARADIDEGYEVEKTCK